MTIYHNDIGLKHRCIDINIHNFSEISMRERERKRENERKRERIIALISNLQALAPEQCLVPSHIPPFFDKDIIYVLKIGAKTFFVLSILMPGDNILID